MRGELEGKEVEHMRIIKAETFGLHVPLGRTIQDATYTFKVWGLSGVILHGETGTQGTGFAGLEGTGEEQVKSVLENYYIPVVLNRDSLDVRQIWNDCYWGKAHWFGRGGITQLALSALDIALWDLNSKAAGLPLWKYLGGEKKDSIPAYNTDAGWLNLSKNELVSQLCALVDKGWCAVKMKIGRNEPSEDIERVGAVRKAIGPQITLMVDVNMGWRLDTALVWAPRLADFAVYWLEEPFHPDEIESHAVLARHITTPLAAGENIFSKFIFRDYVRAGAITFLQPDCTRIGGITEWLNVAGLAACWGLPVVPHLADGAQVHQHLVAAATASQLIEYVPWLRDCFEDPVQVKGGKVLLPAAAGASTTFRKSAFKRYRVA